MSEDEIAKNPPVDPLRDIDECFAIHALPRDSHRKL